LANFTLFILEYSVKESLLECEQKWINLIKPDYNLYPTAGNCKGYKHTEETIIKLKNLAKEKKSKEVKEAMSLNRKGENNSFFNKKHSNEALNLIKEAALKRINPSKPGLRIKDIEKDSISIYNSIRQAADSINYDIKTLIRREKS